MTPTVKYDPNGNVVLIGSSSGFLHTWMKHYQSWIGLFESPDLDITEQSGIILTENGNQVQPKS